MILKQITEAVMNTFGRFKGVETVRYQGDDSNNAQHNYDTIQVYVDDVQYHQYNLTTNIVKAEINVYVLGHPTEERDVLTIQDECYNVAINVIAFLNNNKEWNNIIRLHDWAITTISDYTAQRNAGVLASIIIELPNGVDLCEYENFFNDTPVTPEAEEELTLNIIKLPISNNC